MAKLGSSATSPESKEEAASFLASLLGQNLRVTTSDSRMFLGQFKCTDSDQNIILSQTFEYRLPPPPSASLLSSSSSNQPKMVTQDLTSRYLGLVVVPGEHIHQICVEKFVSQLRGEEREAWEREQAEEGSVV